MNLIDKEDWKFLQDYPIVVRKINNPYDSIIIEKNPSSHPVVINGQEYYRFYKI